jgi:hypothetical protein
MNRRHVVSRTFLLCVFTLVFALVCQAQASRTWVSGVGDDVNPCSRTAPCKTFAGAISKTAKNGEINCLDGGGYGAVTITKSITIDCTEASASILASFVNGVIVNITDPADSLKTVRLRGISINGITNGINGIRVLAANSLYVEDVIIDGFGQHGISIETTSGQLDVVVRDATVSNNAGNGLNTWILGSGTGSLSVSRSTFSGNGVGFNLSQSVKSAFEDSIVNGNNTGVAVNFGSLLMSNCQISHNGTGVQAANGATVIMSANSVTGNNLGLSGSNLVSLLDNVVQGNVTNGSFTSNSAKQ